MADRSTGETIGWSGSVVDHGGWLSAIVVILVTAPRPLWIWFVLVQPGLALALVVVAFAFDSVPELWTVGLGGFVVLTILPVIVAWLVASRREATTYGLDSDRSTLHVRRHREGPASLDEPDDARVDLRDLERLVRVPVPMGDAVVFRPSYRGLHRREGRTAPRVIVVPKSRLPDLERALGRVRGVEMKGFGSSPGVVFRTVLSILVPTAGLVVGVGLILGWLLEVGSMLG